MRFPSFSIKSADCAIELPVANHVFVKFAPAFCKKIQKKLKNFKKRLYKRKVLRYNIKVFVLKMLLQLRWQSASLVRMRSPVQIWLAAPYRRIAPIGAVFLFCRKTATSSRSSAARQIKNEPFGSFFIILRDFLLLQKKYH